MDTIRGSLHVGSPAPMGSSQHVHGITYGEIIDTGYRLLLGALDQALALESWDDADREDLRRERERTKNLLVQIDRNPARLLGATQMQREHCKTAIESAATAIRTARSGAELTSTLSLLDIANRQLDRYA